MSAFAERPTEGLATGELGVLDHSLFYLSMLIALPLYVLGALGYAIACVSAVCGQLLFTCAGEVIWRFDILNCRIRPTTRTKLSRRSADHAHAGRRGL